MTDTTITEPIRRVPVRVVAGRLVPCRDQRHRPARTWVHCDSEGREVELGPDGRWQLAKLTSLQPFEVVRFWEQEAEQQSAEQAERHRQLRLRAEARGEQ